MRYLAIDLGDKRTGLAVGDDVTKIATPLEVLAAAKPAQQLSRIAAVIDSHGPDALVLGLPLNMDGSEGPAAKKARRVAEQLTADFGLAVHLVDERLSSAAADDLMAGSGATKRQKRSKRDALAAATILSRFFHHLD